MPYEMEWKNGGFYTRFFGKITETDLSRSRHEMESHPRFAEIVYHVADCTDVTNVDIRAVALQKLAEVDRDASRDRPAVRTAVVAPDDRVKGLVNVYKLSHEFMGGDWKTGIFETVDEAREWASGEDH